MNDLFDAYQLRARVQPVLLAAFPGAVLAYSLGASDQVIGKVAMAATTFGIVTLFVAMARDRGLRLEQQLWASWGGPPTTTMMLSTSDQPSSELEMHRYHVQRLLPETEPLSDNRDCLDPDGSRRAVERYIGHLRERTRDRSMFPIVFDANVGYGFRRNVLGLRPVRSRRGEHLHSRRLGRAGPRGQGRPRPTGAAAPCGLLRRRPRRAPLDDGLASLGEGAGRPLRRRPARRRRSSRTAGHRRRPIVGPRDAEAHQGVSSTAATTSAPSSSISHEMRAPSRPVTTCSTC